MAGTIVASTINTDTGLFSTNNAYLGIAKAWVQWAGSTGVIASSLNVSSVTHTSTGVWVVNFTTAMPNANYAINTSGSGDTTGGGATTYLIYNIAPTTTGFTVGSCRTNNAVQDTTYMFASVFSA